MKSFNFNIKSTGNSCTVSLEEIPAQDPQNQEWIAKLTWQHDPPSRKDGKIFIDKIFPKLCKQIKEITGNAWVFLETPLGALMWVDSTNSEAQRELRELLQELSEGGFQR